MDGQAIVTVSGAVVALTQMVKWSPVPTTGLIPIALVFGLAALGVLLWAVSTEPAFDRSLLFSYFAGWIAVATSAAGVFGLAKASAESLTGNKP